MNKTHTLTPELTHMAIGDLTMLEHELIIRVNPKSGSGWRS